MIYYAFLDTLENPERQTRREMKEIAKRLQEEPSSEQQQKLLHGFKLLKERLFRLQSENEKKVFVFVLESRRKIFNNINQKVRSLSEENFLQFLISVFEKIRKKKLDDKRNLENSKIKRVVDECVDSIRSIEAKDSLTRFAGWQFGIRVDPKNVSGSLMSELKKKTLFLGGGKEDRSPLTDEEILATFLCKIFLPTFFSIALILVKGSTTFTIVAFALCTTFAVKRGMEDLFSNNKRGTLYNPDSEKEKEWSGKISSRIGENLKFKVNRVEQNGQPTKKKLDLSKQIRENQESFRKKKEEISAVSPRL